MATNDARDDGSTNRTSADAYTRYLAGMDASMRQKVALTAAYLLTEGRVADMGTGSGEGAMALASLYPELEVVGVDLDAEMVRRASAKHVRPNLAFVQGNVAEDVFAPGSLAGLFDSSVLHHVTSFGGYDHDAAARCLAVQVRALGEGGVLVVRDFLAPDDADAPVWLDVPEGDVAWLERASREHRSLHPQPGFPCERVVLGEGEPPLDAGFVRFALTRRHAVEFLLRKDYRADWDAEIKEEYTYFDRAAFERVVTGLGLRLVASSPLRNPWIVRHRFEGRARWWSRDGVELDWPATNYIVVGERVRDGEGVAFRDAGEVEPLGFLEATAFLDRRSGTTRDLVRRPGVVADVVPFFVHDGRLYVLARTSYPRPILGTRVGDAALLDGAGVVPWLAEPLHVQITDEPFALAVEEELARTAGIASSSLRRFLPGTTYFPSPGGLLEEVRSVFVEIAPRFDDVALVGVSPFSTSGRVRPIEAQQVLRAAQVGGLPDARLELNVRSLLARLREEALANDSTSPSGALAASLEEGPWIADQPPRPPSFARSSELGRTVCVREALATPARRVFERGASPSGFLRLHARRFEELDAKGRVLGAATLELVVPTSRRSTTVALAVIAYVDGEPCLGVDEDDLPAAQCFAGNSAILVAPAWRLPSHVTSERAAQAFVMARVREEHGLVVDAPWALGGRYFPSPGATPEVVHPWFAFVASADVGPRARTLRFVRVAELVDGLDTLLDGHLRVVVGRTASMLGVRGRRA